MTSGTVSYTHLEWKDDHIELFSVIDGSSSASKDKEAQSPFYAPTYLPEGFELTDIQYNFASTHLRYEKGDQFISITIYSSSAGLSMDNEHTQYYFDYEVQDLSLIHICGFSQRYFPPLPGLRTGAAVRRKAQKARGFH